MRLYELTENYANLMTLLGYPAIEESVIQAALAELGGQIEEKAEGYAKVRQTLLAEAEAYKVESDRLAALARVRKNGVERLQQVMADSMRLAQISEIQTPIGKWGFQKNPPAVYILNAGALPAEYWRQPEPEADKSAIKEALKAGRDVPGAELRQGESLRFK